MRFPGLLLVLLAACGRAELRGELADGFAADRVVDQAGAEAAVRDGAFSLAARDSLSLRFVRGGDTVGRMDLAGAGEHARTFSGLRADPATGRVFPRAISGPDLAVNGIRFSASALPDSVDRTGRVLASTDAGDALLFRPEGEGADLRVRVDSATRVETTDGQAVPGWRSRAGDSMRVSGPVRDGIVHASRLLLRSEVEMEGEPPPAEAEPGPVPDPAPAVVPRTTAPRVSAPPGRSHGRGHGRGRGRGHGRKG